MPSITIYLSNTLDSYLHKIALEEETSKPKAAQQILLENMRKNRFRSVAAIQERLDYIEEQRVLGCSMELKQRFYDQLIELFASTNSESLRQRINDLHKRLGGKGFDYKVSKL